MIYIDTNIIIYSYFNPGDSKHIISKQIIEGARKKCQARKTTRENLEKPVNH